MQHNTVSPLAAWETPRQPDDPWGKAPPVQVNPVVIELQMVEGLGTQLAAGPASPEPEVPPLLVAPPLPSEPPDPTAPADPVCPPARVAPALPSVEPAAGPAPVLHAGIRGLALVFILATTGRLGTQERISALNPCQRLPGSVLPHPDCLRGVDAPSLQFP